MKNNFFLFVLLSITIFSCSKEEEFSIEETNTIESTTKNNSPVQLVKAFNSYSFYRGFNTWTRKFTVKVANLALDKNVSVFHEKVDGNWEEIPLNYSFSIDNQQEIWTGEYQYFGYTGEQIYDNEFVVKYDVNGTTYWDNNNGNNYVIEEREIGYLFADSSLSISVDSAYLFPYFGGGNQLNVIVDVKNVAPAKEVEVVYTTDGWQTKQYLALNFTKYWYSGYQYALVSPNPFNIERWTGSLVLDDTVDNVEYAVVYRVNGQEYWDNNYGNNYIAESVN